MSGNVVPVLWYENEQGEKWFPPGDHCDPNDTPDGFRYQHYRNPFELHDSICTAAGKLCSGTTTYPGDLALALCRPTLRQQLRAIVRYGTPGPRLALDAAILRAAGCERCMNTLAHRVGLSWGYRRDSSKDRSRTSCEYCEPPTSCTAERITSAEARR